jgi:hypothetical protein
MRPAAWIKRTQRTAGRAALSMSSASCMFHLMGTVMLLIKRSLFSSHLDSVLSSAWNSQTVCLHFSCYCFSLCNCMQFATMCSSLRGNGADADFKALLRLCRSNPVSLWIPVDDRRLSHHLRFEEGAGPLADKKRLTTTTRSASVAPAPLSINNSFDCIELCIDSNSSAWLPCALESVACCVCRSSWPLANSVSQNPANGQLLLHGFPTGQIHSC